MLPTQNTLRDTKIVILTLAINLLSYSFDFMHAHINGDTKL